MQKLKPDQKLVRSDMKRKEREDHARSQMLCVLRAPFVGFVSQSFSTDPFTPAAVGTRSPAFLKIERADY